MFKTFERQMSRYLIKKGLTSNGIHTSTVATLGKYYPLYATVKRRVAEFKCSMQCPCSLCNPRNVNTVHEIVVTEDDSLKNITSITDNLRKDYIDFHSERLKMTSNI